MSTGKKHPETSGTPKTLDGSKQDSAVQDEPVRSGMGDTDEQGQERALDTLLETYADHSGGADSNVSLTELRAYALGELDGDRAQEVAAVVSRNAELRDLVERYRHPDPDIKAAAWKGFLEGLRGLEDRADRGPKGAESALPAKPRAARPVSSGPWVTAESARRPLSYYLRGVTATLVVAGLALFLLVPHLVPRDAVDVVAGTMRLSDATRSIGEPVERLVVGQEIPLQLTPPLGARYAVFLLVTDREVNEVGELAIRPGSKLRRRLFVREAPVGRGFLLLVYSEREVESKLVAAAIAPALKEEPSLTAVSRTERNDRIRAALSKLDIGRIWMETSTLLSVEQSAGSREDAQETVTP